MTPLSDALTAAQKRALTALEKAYVAGALEPEGLSAALNACGISDPVDIDYLTECLNVLNAWGASVPAETNGTTKDEPASDKQMQLIRDLMVRKQITGATPEALTKSKASDVINDLQAGTYDPHKWQPF